MTLKYLNAKLNKTIIFYKSYRGIFVKSLSNKSILYFISQYKILKYTIKYRWGVHRPIVKVKQTYTNNLRVNATARRKANRDICDCFTGINFVGTPDDDHIHAHPEFTASFSYLKRNIFPFSFWIVNSWFFSHFNCYNNVFINFYL